jgi:hypothetical protein
MRQLSGKYILYRRSFRDNGWVIGEVFAIKPSANPGYMDFELHSFPARNDTAEPEVFTGRFYRYGKLYCAMGTYLDSDDGEPRMRFLQFCQVALAEGTYSGLVTGVSKRRDEVAASLAAATKISASTEIVEADKKLIALIETSHPNYDEIEAVTSNVLRQGSSILVTDNHDRRIEKLRLRS